MRLAVGQADGGVAVWTLAGASAMATPEHTALLWAHPYQPVTALHFHKDGDWLASAAGSHCICTS